MIAAISFSCSRGLSPSMQTLPLLRQLLEPHHATSSLDQRKNRFLSTPSADAFAHWYVVGSLLIPRIVGRSSKQAAVADTRLKQALQVMATSNGVDATINKIETAFEGFEKDSLLIRIGRGLDAAATYPWRRPAER
jgi:hypothetical protein